MTTYHAWHIELMTLFDERRLDRPDAEEAATHFDHGRAPDEAMRLIVGEREKDAAVFDECGMACPWER